MRRSGWILSEPKSSISIEHETRRIVNSESKLLKSETQTEREFMPYFNATMDKYSIHPCL